MAQIPNRASKARAAKPDRPQQSSDRVVVTRDASFQRVYADDLITTHRPYDTQLSFFIKGPEVAAFESLDDARIEGSSGVQNIAHRISAAEVVRVHVPNDLLFNMAMQLFDEIIDQDINDADYLVRSVESLLKFKRERAAKEPGES